MENSILYSTLTRFGDYYPLNLKCSQAKEKIKEIENTYKWVQYNPRKKIDRWGLSITSLDGGLSGRPDLDSLYEHYKKTGEIYDETDFTTPTVLYDYFKNILDPFKTFLGRTHIIKLEPGGYFPPHRDNKNSNVHSFRLFVPLNYNHVEHFFMLENKKMEFENEKVYFIDTALLHTVFNTSNDPFYFIVVNIILSTDSVNKTLSYLHG